jgi:hypothetical protein
MATKQVQLSVEEIRKNKFFIATPCYGGQLNEPYFRSVIKMMTFFNGHQLYQRTSRTRSRRHPED